MVNKWIKEYTKNKSFVDIGGLWNTVNERVTVAYKSEAKSVTMIDIQEKDNIWWEKFHDRCKEFEVKEYNCMVSDITQKENLQKIGKFDIVHCSGILYHLQDPLVLIDHLYEITNEFLMLGTTTIPDVININNEQLVTEKGTTYFIPNLGENQKKFFKAHFDKEKLSIAGISNNTPVHWYNEKGEVNYGPWWWLFTKDYIISLLALKKFEVIDTYENWENKAHMFLCKKISENQNDK